MTELTNGLVMVAFLELECAECCHLAREILDMMRKCNTVRSTNVRCRIWYHINLYNKSLLLLTEYTDKQAGRVCRNR
jgi:hypothetical protein